MTANWRKSSRSGSGANNCVEVARTATGTRLRDSKSPASGHLAFGTAAFHRLRAAVDAGRFERRHG